MTAINPMNLVRRRILQTTLQALLLLHLLKSLLNRVSHPDAKAPGKIRMMTAKA